MSEKSKIKKIKAEVTEHVGKLYLLKSDIWAIDATNEGFIQVYTREQVFKIKPEQLAYVEDFVND